MVGYAMFLSGSAIGSASAVRETGLPTSPNKASSASLFYPATIATEVAVTVQVLTLPNPPQLVFWGLQLDLIDNAGESIAAPHFGLQWMPGYPNSHAVNWGGYIVATGLEMNGTTSALPSALNNPNTRDYDWVLNRQYRYRVWVPSPGVFRGEITDLVTTTTTVVRDLSAPGATQFRGAILFAENFNTCQTAISARWTNLQFKLPNATFSTPTSAVVDYQIYADGGCTNTNTSTSGGGIVMASGTPRVVPAETSIATS